MVGEWSAWKCNSKCYNPGMKYSNVHTQTKTRTCRDFKYRPGVNKKKIPHPDPAQRCVNIPQEETSKGCQNDFEACE